MPKKYIITKCAKHASISPKSPRKYRTIKKILFLMRFVFLITFPITENLITGKGRGKRTKLGSIINWV